MGFVFWPVGTGDSITVLVASDVVVQVDLNHLVDAEGDDDPRYPMINELVELLPRRNGRPYLAVFIATHPDNDHCRGFRRLLEEAKVVIGELWFTPRLVADIDTEDPDSLSDDAKALRDEALRRIGLYSKPSAPASGDRIRVIGFLDSLQEDLEGLDDVVSVPGREVTILDGTEYEGTARLFVHTPFKADMESTERNRTSIGLHVTVGAGDAPSRALLLGDLDYEPVKRLLEITEDMTDKEWDVFLAPHHCSKSVMYQRVDGGDVLQTDVLDLIEEAKADYGWIVASSDPIPGSNTSGDNPPHAKAKNRYTARCDQLLCTGEHPDEDNLSPLIFEATESGLVFLGTEPGGKSGAHGQVRDSRGGEAPIAAAVGFGWR